MNKHITTLAFLLFGGLLSANDDLTAVLRDLDSRITALEQKNNSGSPMVCIAKRNAIVTEQSDLNSTNIGTIKRNATVTVVERKNARIKTDKGWVSEKYFECRTQQAQGEQK